MKKIYIFVLSIFILLFITIQENTLALEVNSLGLGDNPTLPDYIDVIFTWLIGIGVLASSISFVVGAITLILPNPESHNDGKDRMKSAIFGLLLTLSCFVVLKTINVKFVELGPLSEIDDIAGVYYTDGSNYRSAPQENPDTSTLPSEFKTLKYCCGRGCSGGDETPIFVWNFSQKDFGNFSSAIVKEVTCGSTATVGESFKWSYKAPGVYYCLGACSGNTCTGMSSFPIRNTDGELNETFAGKVQSVVFVKDEDNGNGFGVVFHQVKDLDQGGFCPGAKTSHDGNCVFIGNTNLTNSVNVFELNSDPKTSGDGVNFFSEPFGWNAGSDAGYYEVSGNNIPTPKLDLQSSNIVFNWEGTETTESYQNSNGDFKKSPGSVQIKGSYLVMITSRSRVGSGSYCKTYRSSIPDLEADPVTNVGGEISNIIIFPTAD